MAKLHEVLAVEASLKKRANEILAETVQTFTKRPAHFSKRVVSFKSLLDEDSAQGKEMRATVDSELRDKQQDMVTTVRDKLAYTLGHLGRFWDADFQIESTNRVAAADVTLNGKALVKDVPATALLHLERFLTELLNACMHVPTLDPAKGFAPDPEAEKAGAYRARDHERARTKKVIRNHVLALATDKHPEQVQAYNEDVPVGTILTQEWSSMMTPAQKSELLGRIEELFRAVKKARSRANQAEVETSRISKPLVAYILDGK